MHERSAVFSSHESENELLVNPPVPLFSSRPLVDAMGYTFGGISALYLIAPMLIATGEKMFNYSGFNAAQRVPGPALGQRWHHPS